jgi:hypothetical protein
LAGDQSGERETANQTEPHSNKCQPQALPQDQTQHVAALRTQGDPDADLMRPLPKPHLTR